MTTAPLVDALKMLGLSLLSTHCGHSRLRSPFDPLLTLGRYAFFPILLNAKSTEWPEFAPTTVWRGARYDVVTAGHGEASHQARQSHGLDSRGALRAE